MPPRASRAGGHRLMEGTSMRTLWIVVVGALLGMALAILLVKPNATAGGALTAAPARASSACERRVCESLTWLRTPAMRRSNAN